ncbi:DUF3560 domain-containing protein, partial [Streptomyces lunaelactis]
PAPRRVAVAARFALPGFLEATLITITHTHADGTLADGTTMGDGAGDILTANGFRWMRSLEMWGIANSRDQAARRRRIHRAADQLRAAGFGVETSIDDTPRDYETVQRAQHERLEGRRSAIADRSQRLASTSDALLRRSDALVGDIPMGQPSKPGKRGQWLNRSKQNAAAALIRAGELGHEANRQAERVRASVDREESRKSAEVIARRVVRLEAELRTIERSLNGEGMWDGKPASGLHAEELAVQRQVIDIQLAGDRRVLEEASAAGAFGQWTKQNLHPGDLLRIKGDWRKLVRPNPKSVSVDTGYSWVDRYGYEQITSVRCPHQASGDEGKPS